MNEHREKWLTAIRAMTSTAESAAGYLDRRLQFTTAVAKSLVCDATEHNCVVYGVWLAGHGAPIYIGQSNEGRRRLWDLPIGESHHLANSFPPEIWERVVIVFWRQFLIDDPGLEKSLFQALGDGAEKSIGLGLEYLLQSHFKPLFNCRKKRRDGGWREVAWMTSKGAGAKAATSLKEFFIEVLRVWDELAVTPAVADGIHSTVYGRVVFPTLLPSLHCR